jgi:hypothetical protein
MLAKMALLLLLLAGGDVGRVEVRPAHPPPVSAQTFLRGVWEAVDPATYRVIRIDVRDDQGYMALMSLYNQKASLFTIVQTTFPKPGRVTVAAVGIDEPSMKIQVTGSGSTFNGAGLIVASISITQRGHLIDRWSNVPLLAHYGSALEDIADVARHAREAIDALKAERATGSQPNSVGN